MPFSRLLAITSPALFQQRALRSKLFARQQYTQYVAREVSICDDSFPTCSFLLGVNDISSFTPNPTNLFFVGLGTKELCAANSLPGSNIHSMLREMSYCA